MPEIQRGDRTQNQTAEIFPEHAYQKVGNVGGTVLEISFTGKTSNVLIKNTHATQSLYLYLKSSKTAWNTDYLTIAAGASIAVDIRVSSIKLKGSGATTTYEILATLE